MIDDFDDWFAIRYEHSDDDIRSGKLSFSDEQGIALEAISLPENGDRYETPNCATGTITGYLDYSNPATILEPWVQSSGGGTVGINNPLNRAKSRLMASAVLKNIHLHDINEECFETLYFDMPAFSSWYAPDIIKTVYEEIETNTPPAVNVEIDDPLSEEFTLDDNTNVRIHSFARIKREEFSTRVIQRTLLSLEFPSPICYSNVKTYIWRVNTFFSFLLGHRMAQNPYQMRTTHTRKWNNESRSITAELLFQPAFKSKKNHVEWLDAIFTKLNCSLPTQSLLNTLSKSSDEIIYLMSMVLKMETSSKLSVNDFSEFLGCIEDFDKTEFGSGSSGALKSARKKLKKVVNKHGTNDDQQVLKDMLSQLPNRLTLAERLDRLQKEWTKAGFKGDHDSSKIVQIRNDVTHGRAVKLSSEDHKQVFRFNHYLCALSRFHIFKIIGFSEEEIGQAFKYRPHNYHEYAPA